MLSPVSVSARAGKVPALGQTPLPMVQPSKPAGAGGAAAGLGAGVLTLAIAGVGVAFTYGIARESKSKLVKTTGYVLAGAGALVALVEAATVGLVIGKAASA
jgi:hypothetical protein